MSVLSQVYGVSLRTSVRTIWLPWVVGTMLGEVLGFGVPTLAGVINWLLQPPQSLMWFLFVLAGAGEGALLGLAQSLVLRRLITGFAWQRWVLATALAAALAWLIGLLPSTLIDAGLTLPLPLLIGGGIVLGSVFLLSIGGAQWLVLRRYLPNANRWMLANAVAWPIGVAVPVLGIGALPEGAPLAVVAAVGAFSGLAMGFVVGAITGTVLVTLLWASIHKEA